MILASKKDFRIEFYRGSGKGGQHRNKTDTACRITHTKTGLSSSCEETRSQSDNKIRAFKRLAEKLVPILLSEAGLEEEKPELEKRVVRTYNKEDDRVKDHRTGQRISYRELVEKCKTDFLDEVNKELAGKE